MKQRLDQALVIRGLVSSRSQAESYIKLGKVKVGNEIITKPNFQVGDGDKLAVLAVEQYVSRAALKLASVAVALKLDFKNKIVLDVGSSTGGFTDYALRHGAEKVIAVDVGTNQLHPNLRNDPRIELHEQTDIRTFVKGRTLEKQIDKSISAKGRTSHIDLVVIDVSFISLRDILPSVGKLVDRNTQTVAMVKPQFEVGDELKHKGVIKNDHMRREILKSFEHWAQQSFVIINKADSEVSGTKGNQERFYLLAKIK